MSARQTLLLPNWISGLLIGGAIVALTLAELRFSLRRSREPKLRRAVRNLTMAGIGAAVMALAERPAVLPLTRLAAERGWGLLGLFALPPVLRIALGALLLDYTLYLWHVLTHRVPFLWRFHLVHHIDRDLDASTALRFHFGELLCSVPFRAAQVMVFGIDAETYSLWQTLLFLSILFHHSNVRLPDALERGLSLLLTTPRLHGIHHDALREHTDSNWSSGLSIWDRMHGTLRTEVAQSSITVGVPAYQEAGDVVLARCLTIPFVEQRDDWQSQTLR